MDARPIGRAGRRAALLLFALSIAACRTAPGAPPGAAPRKAFAAPAATIVRVTFREAPLAGARVTWLRPEGPSGWTPAFSGATDGEGKAGAEIAPGKYFVVAQWRRDGDFARPIAAGDRFCWFGGNPVYVAAGPSREIFLGLEEYVPPSGPWPLPPAGAGIEGFVLSDGAPLEGAHVFAYLRPDTGFRDMGFAASAPTDRRGGFLLDVPPGRYYIVARKRAGGALVGPLRKGDYFGFYPANPVDVFAGNFARVVVPAGRLKLRNAPSYSGEYAASAFIEGRIVDRRGRPREGVYAALYDNPELLNRPVFLSDVTGADGRYRLPVPVPGRYFLGARSGYGGSPVPGDLYGRYEGTPDHAIVVGDGDRLTPADIVVDEIR